MLKIEFSDRKDHFQLECCLDMLFSTDYLREEFCSQLNNVTKHLNTNYIIKIVNNE